VRYEINAGYPIAAKQKALGMYERMALIRKYEERIYYLFLEGSMPGTIHQSHGQEACAVGMLWDLGHDDFMTSTHRPAGHALAKGVPLRSMMCEMFAKSNGCCRAKGGAMHVGDMSVGAFPAIAIVAGGMPVAVGAALSCKMRKTKNVTVCFLGDGASNEGAFHESMNAAAIWDLPLVFACENNLYGASTPISMTCKLENIADRAASYGMQSEVADGNDVFAVNAAAGRAIEKARGGGGPTFLELKTYRMGGHSRNDACGYRSKKEERIWLEKEPLRRCRAYLLENNLADEKTLENIDKKIAEDIEDAVEFAKMSPDPKPEDALKDIFYERGEI
jgi:pyruvate dehydrogenase E1 component alpha subunit